jgi:3-phenylpropionate/trans-cinnamate dioxygenase ferredoxin reductase subunit
VAEPVRIVIAGGGLAGAKAAAALRAEGYDGGVVLIGSEPEPPYERPPLSKGYLAGESPREEARVHDEGFYAEHGVELRVSTRVESIDPAGRIVTTGHGDEIPWDRLLLATGAASRRLPLPGVELDGVHHLRTLAEADSLKDDLGPGRRLAIVGGGWIGAEVAATARGLGAEVVLFERDPVMLGAVLGDELGALFEEMHREHGVTVRTEARVAGLAGAGRVEAVELDGGERVACDLALIAVGAVPRDELAAAAGVASDGGVLVDERLESSVPGIYAAGDVARALRPSSGRQVRVEHWANAIEQGERAARTMLGGPAGDEPLPYFFSDQYDLGMEYTGDATGSDELVIRGDREARELIAFWLREGRVIAGMNVNVWDVADEIAALIRARAPVDRDRLGDPGVALAALAPESAGSG